MGSEKTQFSVLHSPHLAMQIPGSTLHAPRTVDALAPDPCACEFVHTLVLAQLFNSFRERLRRECWLCHAGTSSTTSTWRPVELTEPLLRLVPTRHVGLGRVVALEFSFVHDRRHGWWRRARSRLRCERRQHRHEAEQAPMTSECGGCAKPSRRWALTQTWFTDGGYIS